MTPVKVKSVEEQLAYVKKGVAEIVPEAELKAKLENSLKTGKPLRAYLGVDPTAPDLHLGHTVVLRKLKHFQDLGHTAVFLIGDFSAMIGDPTGVSETRPPLTREQVDANAKTYLAQVYKILDKEKAEVRYNSEWLSKMSAEDVVRLCSHYRVARMLEREDFHSRLDKGQPISVHELLYPLLTAIDAVILQSDVDLGATAENFQRVFRDRQAPVEVPIFRVPAGPPRKIWDLLLAAGMVSSKSEGERLFEQGGLELVGDQPPLRVERSIALIKGQSHLIKVG